MNTKERAHYEWMLENLTLNPSHHQWIIDQLDEDGSN